MLTNETLLWSPYIFHQHKNSAHLPLYLVCENKYNIQKYFTLKWRASELNTAKHRYHISLTLKVHPYGFV